MGVAVGDAPQVWARGHCPPVHKAEREKTWTRQLISRASVNLDVPKAMSGSEAEPLGPLERCSCHLQGLEPVLTQSEDRPQHRLWIPCMQMYSSTYKWRGPDRPHYFHVARENIHPGRAQQLFLMGWSPHSNEPVSTCLQSLATPKGRGCGLHHSLAFYGMCEAVHQMLTELWQPHSTPPAGP